ncbi:MAG: hypothetical protein B7Z16_03450 [Algoriphagus sp. 32-45-6]|nr:MAG: hypothetical protein B7Z16_03450 [Algoriphagus sp. 32-45-6]
MKYLIYIYLIFFAFACSSKEKSKEIQQLQLADLVADTLYLEKDSLTKSLGAEFTFFEKDGEKYISTFIRHQLLTFSFPEGKLLQKVKFEVEGPDGIGSFISGNHREDTLIQFLSTNKWITATVEGKVLSRLDLPDSRTDRMGANYSTSPYNPIRKIGNSYLISDLPFVLKEDLLSYQKWMIKFDPSDSTSEYVEFSYPKKYKDFLDDSMFGPYSHGYNEDRDELIVSFPASDSLLVISKAGQNWVPAFPSERMEFLRGTTEQRGEYIVFNTNPRTSMHSWVHYEPISKKTIRLSMITPDTDLIREEGKTPLSKFIILDENYQKEAEVVVPFRATGFQTPDGYYLYLGSIQSEDKVAYVRLDFSKINP